MENFIAINKKILFHDRIEAMLCVIVSVRALKKGENFTMDEEIYSLIKNRNEKGMEHMARH